MMAGRWASRGGAQRTGIRTGMVLLLGLAGAGQPLWAEQQCDGDPTQRSAPDRRFEDQGDGSLTDRTSRLTWQRCSAGQSWTGARCEGEALRMTWVDAQAHADRVNASGEQFFKDWRVPQLRELATLTERQCQDPRINLRMFPATPAGAYWTVSSRPAPGFEGSAYVLGFDASGVQLAAKDEKNHVRLVRSGL